MAALGRWLGRAHASLSGTAGHAPPGFAAGRGLASLVLLDPGAGVETTARLVSAALRATPSGGVHLLVFSDDIGTVAGSDVSRPGAPGGVARVPPSPDSWPADARTCDRARPPPPPAGHPS